MANQQNAEKIAQLKERIDRLETQKQEQQAQIKEHEKELARDKKMREASARVFPWVCVLGVIVLALSGTEYFHWAEVAVVGAVLGLCIFFKIMEKVCFRRVVNKYGSWYDAKQAGKELKNQLAKMEREQARKQREIDLIEGKPDALRVYRGFDWNMKSFKATPANIKAMELDLENLFVSLKYIAGSKQQVDNWMGRSRKKRFKAAGKGDIETTKQYDEGYKRMAQAGSWKLQIGWVAATLLDDAWLFPDSDRTDPIFFRRLCERENVRGPETPEEKEFYDDATIATALMGGSFRYIQKHAEYFD